MCVAQFMSAADIRATNIKEKQWIHFVCHLLYSALHTIHCCCRIISGCHRLYVLLFLLTLNECPKMKKKQQAKSSTGINQKLRIVTSSSRRRTGAHRRREPKLADSFMRTSLLKNCWQRPPLALSSWVLMLMRRRRRRTGEDDDSNNNNLLWSNFFYSQGESLS